MSQIVEFPQGRVALDQAFTSDQVASALAAAMDREGGHSERVLSRAVMDVAYGFGGERREQIEPDADIEEWTILTVDGMVTLTYGNTPAGRGATMHVYRLEPEKSRSWEY